MEEVPTMGEVLDVEDLQEEEYSMIVELGAETLEGLGELHRQGALCDVTLDVQGKTFKAHRAFLAATSGFFRAYFTEDMDTPKEGPVKVENVSAQGVEAILDYLYNQKIALSMDAVTYVVEAAKHLKVSSVLNRCSAFLIQSLCEGKHLQVLCIAKEFSLKEVHQAVLVSLWENWNKVSTDILNQLCYDDMMTFLDGHIQCRTEAEVFNIAQQWLEVSPDDRMPHVIDILSKVRFPLLTPAELDAIVKEPSFLVDEQCRHLVDEARSYHAMPVSSRVLEKGLRTHVRGPPMNVAFAGGLGRSPSKEKITAPYVLDFATDFRFRWLALPPIGDHMGAASILIKNNFLIACGVDCDSPEAGGIYKGCAVYDPRSHAWLPLAPMITARVDFPLVAYKNTMFALGGATQWDPRTPTGEVEQFRFADNEWSVVTELPEKLSNHAACETKGQIYICGGIDSNMATSDKVWSYDPLSGEWAQMAPLLQGEHGHCLLPLSRDKLSLISATTGNIYNLCLETNQWSLLDVQQRDPTKYHDVNVWEFTPSLAMITWCRSTLEGADDHHDGVTCCQTGQQMVQLPSRDGLESPWPTRRIWTFPDGVFWRHSALLALPWAILANAQVDSTQEGSKCCVS